MDIEPLTSVEDWDKIWEDLASAGAPLRLIFKASSRCPISHRAEEIFRDFISGFEGKKDLRTHIVQVIEHRDVSDRIASDTAVTHQSPQVLLLGPGREILWHTSHTGISKRNLSEALSSAG